MKNYSGVTSPGRDMAGNMKINQDTLIINTNINNIKDFNLFGVFDGHGPDGILNLNIFLIIFPHK